MSKVTTGATMSLDGFIADAEHGGFDYLFKWYGAGDVEVPTGHPDMTFKVSAASAEHRSQFEYPQRFLVDRAVLHRGMALHSDTIV